MAGTEPSVGTKGDSYDNAFDKITKGLQAAEFIHRRAPWKTEDSSELATLKWVFSFTHHLLHEPIG